MEDVLDLYAEPYYPERRVVGFDERPLQLVAEKRTRLADTPGRHRRIDYEYRRNGTCNLFTTVEPLARWRHVEVTQRRTAVDFAHQNEVARRGRLPRHRGRPRRAREPEYSCWGMAVRGVSSC